jgi:glycosyltransferase involved in cell wall biosynthesis
MKILLILEATLGGTSRHILDLANGLLERGAEVHLVYSTLRADQGFLRGLSFLGSSWERFRCKELPITRSVTVSDFASYWNLARYIGEEGPFDIIHSHSTKAGFLARLLVNTQGARMIYTSHGLMTMNPELTGFRRRAVCALESALARRTDTVIAVSENERRCALETGIGPAKLTVIANGIHSSSLSVQSEQRKAIRDSIGLNSEAICIGWVGRFAPQKRPDRAFEAYELLQQRTAKPLRLLMIGWGPLEDALRRQVAELNIEDQVLFLGQAEAVKYMPAFDILAHTSEFEAFGYVFVEALSSGVPIVTTRVGGTDELISNGVTGYVCDPWDPETFASRLQLLAEDPQRRRAMSEAARQRAAHYSVERMVDSTVELYRQACGRSGSSTEVPARYQTITDASK